jgi:hypothetical protein
MAGPTIDDAFITKFNRDVHLAYQRERSMLRGMCRTDAEVDASGVRFQKLGTMTVSGKARNADIAIQNPAHTHVDVSLLDRYGAVLIDKLDLTKLNIAVREGYVYDMSAAFGRETDKQITDALSAGATQNIGGFSGNITRNNALLGREALDRGDVPSDGRIYWAVTPRMWSHLMTFKEFTSADFVSFDNLPWKNLGLEMKIWNRSMVFQFNGLPGVGTSTAKSYMWHWRSVGHAIGDEVDITWQWENLKKGWSGAGSMSMNAVVIDPAGIMEFRVDDTTALPAPT